MIPYFDDPYSYLHPVMGFLARSGPLGNLILVGFVVYQLFEKEPMPNKIGDFVEFGIGYVAAGLVKR